MIEIKSYNPWSEHLQALEADLRRSERQTEHLRQQYTQDLDRAQVWQREADEAREEQERNDAAEAADRDEQGERGIGP